MLYTSLYTSHSTTSQHHNEEKIDPKKEIKEEKEAELPPFKDGYPNDIRSILAAQKHPVILAEEAAMRRMGLRVGNGEVCSLYLPCPNSHDLC